VQNMPKLTAITALVLTLSAPAFSQPEHAGHQSAGYHAEMMAGMKKMEQEMKAAPMTGNPDVDFAAMMIPHHQGAVDMAKTQLKYGKDEKLRAMATTIIESQEKEIKEMQDRIEELQASDSATTSPTPVPASSPHH